MKLKNRCMMIFTFSSVKSSSAFLTCFQVIFINFWCSVATTQCFLDFIGFFHHIL